jgi:hypothetical protein
LAAAPYLRPGFAETAYRYADEYRHVDADGVVTEVADPCRFLVKQFR